MRFNTDMSDALKEYYYYELIDAKNHLVLKNYQKSWHHLEMAHILGQP